MKTIFYSLCTVFSILVSLTLLEHASIIPNIGMKFILFISFVILIIGTIIYQKKRKRVIVWLEEYFKDQKKRKIHYIKCAVASTNIEISEPETFEQLPTSYLFKLKRILSTPLTHNREVY